MDSGFGTDKSNTFVNRVRASMYWGSEQSGASTVEGSKVGDKGSGRKSL